jgi:hypothetical protein
MFYMAKDSELSPEFLIDESSLKYYPLHRECEPTADQLAEYCDQECENANYHDLVGAHRELVLIISSETDDETARKIMLTVAKRGGLHEIAAN